jgi:hypothetical protein
LSESGLDDFLGERCLVTFQVDVFEEKPLQMAGENIRESSPSSVMNDN